VKRAARWQLSADLLIQLSANGKSDSYKEVYNKMYRICCCKKQGQRSAAYKTLLDIGGWFSTVIMPNPMWAMKSRNVERFSLASARSPMVADDAVLMLGEDVWMDSEDDELEEMTEVVSPHVRQPPQGDVLSQLVEGERTSCSFCMTSIEASMI
jgi:hypothetical protein